MVSPLANIPSYTAAEAARMCPEGYKTAKVGTISLSAANVQSSRDTFTLNTRNFSSSRPGGPPERENLIAHINAVRTVPIRRISDRDDPAVYNKDAALKDVFSMKFSDIRFVNIDGQLNTIMSENFKLAPEEGDLETLEKQLQKDGTAPLMWEDFDAVVRRTFDASQPNSLAKTAGALAANYVAQKHILSSRFDGGELTAQLDKLERSFRAQTDRLAENLAENISSFLPKNGASGLDEKLRASVRAAVDGAVGNYEARTAADPSLLTPAEGPDAWLNSHLRYLASQLQAASQDEAAPLSETGELFSLSELEIASRTVNQYRSFVQNGVREDTGAMSLAMLEMQTDTAMRMKGVSADFRQMMDTIRDNAVPKALDRYDRWLTDCRTGYNPKGEKPEWWSALDRGMFQEIYNATMSAYRGTGDALGAIRIGMETAKQTVTQAVEDGGEAMRWTNAIRPGGYFDNFYGGRGGYQNFMNQWQRFLNELGNL